MKRFLLFILLLCFKMHVQAQAYPDSLLFKSYAEQYNFRKNIVYNVPGERDWPQTKKDLQRLQEWAARKGDTRLEYGLALSNNLTSIERNLPDSAEGFAGLNKLIPELERNKMYELKAEALQGLALYYWNRKRYAEGLEYHIDAHKIYEPLSIKQFPAKPEFLRDFGGRYYFFRDYSTAVTYFLAGFRSAPEKDYPSMLSLINTLALCYIHLEKLDSAEYYLLKVRSVAEANGNRAWIGIASGNLGSVYKMEGKYDSALAAFAEEIKILGDKTNMNVANTFSAIAEIYIEKGEPETALEYALKAYRILQTHPNYPSRYDVNQRIYFGLSKGYAAVGDMDKAYRFLDSSTTAKDSLDRRSNAEILAGIRHKISANERLAEREKYEQQSRNSNMLRNILIALIALVVIIAILVYNRMRLKHKFSRTQLEAEKKHVESELDTATRQLGTLVASISEKNELIEKFTAELDRLREHLSEDKLHRADEALGHLQEATVITDDEWEHFMQMFEKVNTGFIDRLNRKLKGLSPIESKFIVLSKMKLSTKEVAVALGISPESVRLNRRRLYNKLGLEEGEHSLQVLLDSI